MILFLTRELWFGALHQKWMCHGCWKDTAESVLGSSIAGMHACAWHGCAGASGWASWLRKWKADPMRDLDISELAFSSDQEQEIRT